VTVHGFCELQLSLTALTSQRSQSLAGTHSNRAELAVTLQLEQLIIIDSEMRNCVDHISTASSGKL